MHLAETMTNASLGDRAGQTIGLSTTHFALDVQGLPEAIPLLP